jgi:hypothetical protein
MGTSSRFVLLSMLFGTTLAIAGMADPKGPPKADVPPPPGINDPAAMPAPTPITQDAAAPATAAPPSDTDPLAPIPKPDTRIVRDRADRDPQAMQQRMASSEHTTRHQGSDTVDEYKQNGHVWMIRIQPQNGPVETFMDTTGNGRLTRDPRQGPVSPVYFSLYEWN